MKDDDEKIPGDRFVEVLQNLRGGATAEELEEQLQALVKRVRDTGKTGTLSLQIKVTPTKAGDGSYDLSDAVKSKLPEFERHRTLFFGTPDGNLQRTDPRQQPLPLRRVEDDAPTTPRRVND